MSVTVKIISPTRVRVEGRRTSPTTTWSFRDRYASARNLAARVEKLSVRNDAGGAITLKQLAPGEFASELEAGDFSYELKLDPPASTSEAAHVSWLAPDHGVLLPGDLLPSPPALVNLRLDLPPGWSVATVAQRNTDGAYTLGDAESAVFYVGRNLRQRRSGGAAASELHFVTTGDWAYADEEASQAAAEIYERHAKIIGGVPASRSLLILAPFPTPADAHAWSAETRGRTVFLLSGRWPSKVTGLAQLSAALTHELLHLWVPNGLVLRGEYDWFYEGFTLYQSLRVGMRLGHFTFDDYLRAIGRAFDVYSAAARGTPHRTLIEASRQRWAGINPGLVYQQGMLVAFLYDLTLRSRSSNRHSLDDVYRELYRRHRAGTAVTEGNRAVTDVLTSFGGMGEFVNQHVLGAQPLDLTGHVAPFGLRVETFGAATRISVSPVLSRPQRDLLRGLGYNPRRGV